MIDTAQWNLSGGVRGVRCEVAEWDADRRAWKDRRFLRSVMFDDHHRIAQLDQRGPHDSVYRTEYRYDDQGRLSSEQSGTAGERAAFARRWTYDERGRETSIVVVHGDGPEETFQESTYDAAGRRTDRMAFPSAPANSARGVKGSEFGYGTAGAVNQITHYDESGHPVEVEFFDPDGAVVRRVQMTLDANGRVAVEEAETPAPIPFDRHPGMTDEQFKAMQTMIASSVGTIRTVYEYDAAGRPSSRFMQMGRLGESRTTYRYDANGNQVEQSDTRVDRTMHVDDDGVPHMDPETTRTHDVRFAYVYDTRGNWTEKIVSARFSADGVFAPTNAEWRTIEYFE
jgi:hypothetical protein